MVINLYWFAVIRCEVAYVLPISSQLFWLPENGGAHHLNHQCQQGPQSQSSIFAKWVEFHDSRYRELKRSEKKVKGVQQEKYEGG